jgi:hypothetical protein
LPARQGCGIVFRPVKSEPKEESELPPRGRVTFRRPDVKKVKASPPPPASEAEKKVAKYMLGSTMLRTVDNLEDSLDSPT